MMPNAIPVFTSHVFQLRALTQYTTRLGKVFSQQKGLRAHLKIHAQREQEGDIDDVVAGSGSEDEERPRKRRRGGEVGRYWICDVDGCGKDFKSKKALNTHHNIAHLGRRDFVCPHDHCRRAFGYKHLLQRHLAKLHAPDQSFSSGDEGNDASKPDSSGEVDAHSHNIHEPTHAIGIDLITGSTYAARAKASLQQATKLQCPFPHLPPSFLPTSTEQETTTSTLTGSSSKRKNDCQYVFSRAYDLRRHLQAEHGIHVERAMVDEWVSSEKSRTANSITTL
ncbi:hypothetical protein BN946_scf184977.g59 [Trametes cinnabarina]|uniref:C2H2-type domain-containing protein n=1 Tax=Pycnoporus cinnabarinus TaxID=5643 RepID=A0A060SD06_PYCCI|nr:hypothetical protein BN946_scf184977.g59 [Trametes cinnabarina]